MPPRSTRPPTIESLLPPILSLLAPPSPNPYSAHQKALTTTARIASTHPSIAIEILFNVSRELLKLGEGGSGSELGVRMISIMGDSDVPVTDASKASITQLIALTPPSGPWRKKLADSAIKWSSNHGECPTGDPSLHQYIGELYYKDKDFHSAEIHLLASGKRDAAKVLAEMMFVWCDRGELDVGAYAVRGTLPFLAHRPPSILPAITFLTTFLSLLESSSSSSSKIFTTSSSSLPSQTTYSLPSLKITTSPTLNFLQLAILTIQRAPAPGISGIAARGLDGGIAKEWTALVNRYIRISGGQGVLGNKDVQEVLGQIGVNVFLIQPPRGQQDMLQNLMGSLFGGGGR